MTQIDPKVLRKLAADYRERASAEPQKARAFLDIAKGLEADAARLESGPEGNE